MEDVYCTHDTKLEGLYQHLQNESKKILDAIFKKT